MIRKTPIRSLLLSTMLLLIPFISSFAALHHFDIELPRKIVAGKPFVLKVTALNEVGKVEKINQRIKVRVTSRGENFDRDMTLSKGKAELSDFTFNTAKIYILKVTDDAADHEVFTTRMVTPEVNP